MDDSDTRVPPATPLQQVDSPLARLHSMDRRIAARVGPLGVMPRTPAPRPQDMMIEVEFGEGRLGLELDWPHIEEIVPGSLACRVRGRRCGRKLRPGMSLAMIAGADCTALKLEQAHAMMVAAGRPLTLCFVSTPESAPEPEPEPRVALALDGKFAGAVADSACEGATGELSPWRRVAALWAQPPHPVSAAPVEGGTQYTFDSIAGRWRQSSVRVRLSTSSFRSGSMRTCFRMLVSEVRPDGRLREWTPRVAKVYTLSLREPPLLDPETHAKMLRTDVRVHERTRELATMYNSRQPPKKVAVLPATIVTVDCGSEGPGINHRMYFVEPFLPGEYVKHTSNYGFVGFQVETKTETEGKIGVSGDIARTDHQEEEVGVVVEVEVAAEEEEEEEENLLSSVAKATVIARAATARQTPQCFSYFSWHASGGKELVSDIQGVQDIYTDPQIHSLVPEGDTEGENPGIDLDGGAGNLGHAGIVACLSTHLYSPQDYYLGLPPFFLSTVEVAAVKDKFVRENGYDVDYSHKRAMNSMQAPAPEPELEPELQPGLEPLVGTEQLMPSNTNVLCIDTSHDTSPKAVSIDLGEVQKSTQEIGGLDSDETDTPVTAGVFDGGRLPFLGGGSLNRTYSGAVCPQRAASLSDLSARTLGVSLQQCSHTELWQHGEMHCCFGLHYCWPWWQSHRSSAVDACDGHNDDLLVLPHPLWHAAMEQESHGEGQTGDSSVDMEPRQWSTIAARFHLALAVGIARRIRQRQHSLRPQEYAKDTAWVAAMASFAAGGSGGSDGGGSSAGIAAAAADCKDEEAQMHQNDVAPIASAEQTDHLWKEFAFDWLFALRHWGTRAWALQPPSHIHDDEDASESGDGLLLQRAELLWKSVGPAGHRSRSNGVRPSLTMISRAVDVIEGQGCATSANSSPVPPRPATRAAADADEEDGHVLGRHDRGDTSNGDHQGGGDHIATSHIPSSDNDDMRPSSRLDVEILGSFGLALE
jgi:hypothetical protein